MLLLWFSAQFLKKFTSIHNPGQHEIPEKKIGLYLADELNANINETTKSISDTSLKSKVCRPQTDTNIGVLLKQIETTINVERLLIENNPTFKISSTYLNNI